MNRQDGGLRLPPSLFELRRTSRLQPAYGLPLLLWMAPVIIGLLLAVPIATLTSAGGRASRLFGTLEQTAPPRVLLRANELAKAAHPSRL